MIQRLQGYVVYTIHVVLKQIQSSYVITYDFQSLYVCVFFVYRNYNYSSCSQTAGWINVSASGKLLIFHRSLISISNLFRFTPIAFLKNISYLSLRKKNRTW
jgi:hypothetical protein